MKPYIKWFAYIIPSLLMQVVGRLLAPVLPFFVQDDGYLPQWLSWFQTPDNTCDGDQGHWERNPGTDAWSTYKRRALWFWRNVAYGFDIDVLGIEVRTTDEILVDGNPDIGDASGISGTCIRYACRGSRLIGWQYMYVKHYSLFGWQRCVRIGAGWKLWNPTKPFKAQYWIFFNPMK